MPYENVRSEWVHVGAHRWHMRVATGEAVPSARPIVLVHGLVVSSRYMVPLAHELGRTHRVVVPDLPGFGLSDKPERTLDVFELADAIDEWMDALGLESASFVGNSFGCQILAHLAVRHPRRVDALVLQGPTTDASRRSAWGQLKGWLLDGFYEPPSETPILIRDYWDAGLRRFFETFRFMLGDRIEEQLPRIAQRTLVVRGVNDRILSQEWAATVKRLLPDGRLVVLPGLAHAVNFSGPLELARVVRAFLERTFQHAQGALS